MLNLSAIRSRLTAMPALLPALAIAASNATAAHASALSLSTGCSAFGDSLKCHLLQFLNLLYALAAFLSLALVVVLVLAFVSYRKNKQRPGNNA